MIAAYIKPILVITGIATASMIAAFFAPALVLDQLFAGAALRRRQPRRHAALGTARILLRRAPHLGRLPSVSCASRCSSSRIVEKIALVIGLLLLPLPLKSGAYVVAGSDATFSVLYLLYLAGL